MSEPHLYGWDVEETGRKLSWSRTAPATPVLPRRSRAVRPLLERLPDSELLPSTRPCCLVAASAALLLALPVWQTLIRTGKGSSMSEACDSSFLA